ncbi:hypothetical protein [Candidatus Caldatribacterium saccharofermentans]|uniref:hypothetical protein n=1 Tax=Candidatus Caldatribacterium saccharofermentans TaxID=1454753 RepID=UPI003D032638
MTLKALARVRLGFLRYEVTVILWMGEVEEEKPIMREFRSGEGFKKHPYNRLTLSDLYRLWIGSQRSATGRVDKKVQDPVS